MHRFAAVALLLLVGCAVNPDGPGPLPDGGPAVDGGGDPCNPVAQTGCAAGEKCTWIDVTDTLGQIACVPDGSISTGGACTTGAPGETSGFDNCVAGNYCIGAVCEEICTVSPDSCPNTSSCGRYSGLFDGAAQELGVCDFLCNPGAQTRVSDGAADCGGNATASRGCYGYAWGSNPIDFTCTPDISAAVHGQPPMPLSPDGNPYLNSCEKGYFPWYTAFDGAAMTETSACVAFCEPGPVSTGNTANLDGLSTSNFECSDRGAVATNTECRYIHIFDATPDVALNNSGVCFLPSGFIDDWNGDMTTGQTESLPACASTDTSPFDDDMNPQTPSIPLNRYWGCDGWVAAATGAEREIQGPRKILEQRLRDRLEGIQRPR